MPLLLQLITVLSPLFHQGVADWKASHGGATPATPQELASSLHTKVSALMAEGDAWKAAHGDAVPLPAHLADLEPIKASLVALLQALSANADGVAQLLLTGPVSRSPAEPMP